MYNRFKEILVRIPLSLAPPLNLAWANRIRLGYLRGCLGIMIYLKDGD